MDLKSKIIQFYYLEHLRPTQIKDKLKVSNGYVTHIIKADSRYEQEKEFRKQLSKGIRKKSQRTLMKKRRTPAQIEFNHSIQELMEQHNRDARELSHGSHLNNEAFRKWNYSAYKYNPSKKRYEFNEKLGRSYAVPKYIKNV